MLGSSNCISCQCDNFALLYAIITYEAQNKIHSAKTSITSIRIDCSERARTCNKITLQKIISQTRDSFTRHWRKQPRRLNQDICTYLRVSTYCMRLIRTAFLPRQWLALRAFSDHYILHRALLCTLRHPVTSVRVRILSNLEAVSCAQQRRQRKGLAPTEKDLGV